MFEILKKEIKVSDKVKLYLISGKEVEVEIIEVGDNYLLVNNSDGTQSRFFETLIGGWNLIPGKNQEEPIIPDIIKIKPESIESKQSPIDPFPEKDKEHKKKIGLTIVGKINLDKIEPNQRKKSESNVEVVNPKPQQQSQPTYTLSQHIREHNLTFSSLQNLQGLKDKINSNNAKQIVPANAILKRYLSNYQYGFVTDSEGKDYLFYFTDILDENLRTKISNPATNGTHLICVLKISNNKTRATNIYLLQ